MTLYAKWRKLPCSYSIISHVFCRVNERERGNKWEEFLQNSFAGISYCEGKKGGAQQVNRDNERPRRHTGRDRFRALIDCPVTRFVKVLPGIYLPGSRPRIFSHRGFVNTGPAIPPMCHDPSYESSTQTVMRASRAYRCIWLRPQIYFIVGRLRALVDRIICTRNPETFNLIPERVIEKIIEREILHWYVRSLLSLRAQW